jgi:hypothetical protein
MRTVCAYAMNLQEVVTGISLDRHKGWDGGIFSFPRNAGEGWDGGVFSFPRNAGEGWDGGVFSFPHVAGKVGMGASQLCCLT